MPASARRRLTVLTVAAVTPGSNGYFTLYPCGTPKPLASSMNFTKGVTIANTVITKLGTNGTICVYSNVTTGASGNAMAISSVRRSAPP